MAGRGSPPTSSSTALDVSEALSLLAAYGLTDDRAPAVVEWAEGSPLALALAADTGASDSDWSPEEGSERPEIVRSLIRRLAESELEGVRLSALGVAAIARVTTVELLRGVLPDINAQEAYEQLRALTFTEPLGDGLALHELVRKALRADLRRRDQERERELRRRIVDYLYEQAQGGDPLLAIDMAHLIENAAIRWGFGWEGSVDYRIDDLGPGDAAEIVRQLTERDFGEWWLMARRFFEEAPERVAIARDREDRLCGYLVCMTPATAPEFAHEDPLVGPWLAHARADAQLGDSVLWHDSIDFTGDRRGRVQAMLGMAGVLRSGAPNPRFAYLPINPANPDALDVRAGARRRAHHRARPRDRAAPDRVPPDRLRARRPARRPAARRLRRARARAAGDRRAGPGGLDREAVREALRNFRVPHELARSPLATGETPEERVESVRELLRDAAERAFGDNENEKLLRRVLIRGYIEPAASHEQAAIDLSLSRAAYFRRLRAAAERVAEYLAARRLGASALSATGRDARPRGFRAGPQRERERDHCPGRLDREHDGREAGRPARGVAAAGSARRPRRGRSGAGTRSASARACTGSRGRCRRGP